MVPAYDMNGCIEACFVRDVAICLKLIVVTAGYFVDLGWYLVYVRVVR